MACVNISGVPAAGFGRSEFSHTMPRMLLLTHWNA
jgi:hypothetical protein